VRRILRGHCREETEHFIAFRSHWRYEATFCTPGEGHEKGGIEGEVGYFRRNHWVPVPSAKYLAELNGLLSAALGEANVATRSALWTLTRAVRVLPTLPAWSRGQLAVDWRQRDAMLPPRQRSDAAVRIRRCRTDESVQLIRFSTVSSTK
jgi:hypothetical protein